MSIRVGDKHRTNRMFRRRIYAQGFTILAMLAGSIYWESDRAKRKQYDGLVEEKNKKEKHEAWLRELEARAEEEEQLRKMRDRIVSKSRAQHLQPVQKDASTAENVAEEDVQQPKGGLGVVRSVLEHNEISSTGSILCEVRKLWYARR
jgi:hypothetical protein